MTAFYIVATLSQCLIRTPELFIDQFLHEIEYVKHISFERHGIQLYIGVKIEGMLTQDREIEINDVIRSVLEGVRNESGFTV